MAADRSSIEKGRRRDATYDCRCAERRDLRGTARGADGRARPVPASSRRSRRVRVSDASGRSLSRSEDAPGTVVDRADLTRADRYVEIATAAGEWVKNAAVSGEDGRTWPTVAGKPETVDPSLLGAEAGVILFLVDLWRTTGSPEAAAAVVDAVRRIGAVAPSADRWGLYDGLSGLALSAARAADALDDDLGVTVASLVDQLLRESRPTPGHGLEWPALPPPDGRGPWNELYRGLAGIGLVLLELDHRDQAVACGNRLVDLALRADVGCWWRSRPDDYKPAPNIAHGTTGIAYFLATLGIATGEHRYGQMALDGARYLLSIALEAGQTRNEELVALLREVKATTRTAILSNAWPSQRPRMVAAGLDDLVHELLLSCEIGAAKPEASAFQIALERLGTAAEDTLFVDDTPSHVEVAVSLGLQGLVHRTTDDTVEAIRRFTAPG